MGKILLSPKFKDFLKFDDFTFAFLESCTAVGKTTVGAIKFMVTVAKSTKQAHAIAGLNLGVIERNIVNKDCGIQEVFGDLVEYYPNGHGKVRLPHIVFHTPNGDKIVYLVGYDTKATWKKILGTQFGVIFIDEANEADLDFIQEITMRCDRAFFTQNPDDPGKDWYKQYVNHSRPLDRYRKDYPQELLEQLCEPVKDKWVHWYFHFEDNLALTDEKRQKIIDSNPVGTKRYFSKILGLRRKTTGVVFVNFDRKKHAISRDKAKELIRGKVANQTEWFDRFSAGLDTAYSSTSPDTIAMSFIGITNKGNCYLLNERVYNNANLDTPIAPSDTVEQFIAFLDRNVKEWGEVRDTFIDSADQATITEFAKHKRQHGSVYNFNNAYKKLKVFDRITLQLGWFAHNNFFIVDDCKVYQRELDIYSWKENKDSEPEDANDHMINSVQYAWIPYKNLIGVDKQ